MVMKVGVGELSCHVDAHFSSYIFNCFLLLASPLSLSTLITN
jgi:hypothetical protein